MIVMPIKTITVLSEKGQQNRIIYCLQNIYTHINVTKM